MTTHLQLAMGRRSLILLCFLVASNAFGNNTGTIAFPGAEGYGRFAQGGRGGDVYAVTNLLDDGKVRSALPQRLITAIMRLSWELCESRLKPSCQGSLCLGSAVFEVSCAVELTRLLNMLSLYVTIAKQTVPGDGIFSKDCDFLSSLMKK